MSRSRVNALARASAQSQFLSSRRWIRRCPWVIRAAVCSSQVDWGDEGGLLAHVGICKVYSFHMTLSYSGSRSAVSRLCAAERGSRARSGVVW